MLPLDKPFLQLRPAAAGLLATHGDGQRLALADKHDISYNDVAIFYRTNNSSRALEEVFIRAGIPYKVVGGVRFYERKEIRDIVAYLRVLDNPGDAVSMRRILNTPRRGIGDRAEACVAVHAENTGSSFNDALHDAAEGKVAMLNSRSEKAIASFVELLQGLRAGLENELGDLVEAVLDRTGYRKELESSPVSTDNTTRTRANACLFACLFYAAENRRIRIHRWRSRN